MASGGDKVIFQKLSRSNGNIDQMALQEVVQNIKALHLTERWAIKEYQFGS